MEHCTQHSPYIIGLDIGTSSCKGILFDLCGNAVTSAKKQYAPVHLSNGWVEQNPEEWVAATVNVLQKIVHHMKRLGISKEQVAGIGISAQISTHILLDDHYRPLCNAILWQDRRAEREAEQVKADWSAERLAEVFGLELPVGASWPLPRLMWLKAHRPDLFENIKYWCQPKDYIGLRLTGVLASDLSSSRGLVNMDSGQIAPAVSDYLGISQAILPPLLNPTDIIGSLTKRMVDTIGLSDRTAVFVGWNDYHCALIGGGIYRIGMGFDVTGTSEHAGVIIQQNMALPLLKGVNRVPLLESKSVVYGQTSSGGGALQWYVENIARHSELGIPVESIYEHIMEEVEQTEAGSKGLLFLPYLNGERAPIWDAKAKGVFFGLQMQHTKKEMARAVMEGVGFSIRHILETVKRQTGVEPATIRMTGGSSRSRIWNQVKADILQKPHEIPKEWDSGALGAAILAAVGLGVYANIEQSIEAMVHIGDVIEPNSRHRDVYESLFETYLNLYPALQSVFHKESAKLS